MMCSTLASSRLRIQHNRLYFAFLNHLWLTDRREEAMHRLSPLCDVVDLVSHCEYVEDSSLRAACWLELGEWKIEEMTSLPPTADSSLSTCCRHHRRSQTQYSTVSTKYQRLLYVSRNSQAEQDGSRSRRHGFDFEESSYISKPFEN